MGSQSGHSIATLDERRSDPIATGPVVFAPGYLAAVRRVERLEANREGADKSWVWEALQRNRAHFKRALRL